MHSCTMPNGYFQPREHAAKWWAVTTSPIFILEVCKRAKTPPTASTNVWAAHRRYPWRDGSVLNYRRCSTLPQLCSLLKSAIKRKLQLRVETACLLFYQMLLYESQDRRLFLFTDVLQDKRNILYALAAWDAKPRRRAMYARQRRLYNQLCCEVLYILMPVFMWSSFLIIPLLFDQLVNASCEYIIQPFTFDRRIIGTLEVMSVKYSTTK